MVCIERINGSGSRYYVDLNNQYHRDDGPAFILADGGKYWFKHGKCHREDGPAIEDHYTNGDKHWWINGKRHREDGPAIEWASGSKEWFKHGQLHREDGPAIEHRNGTKIWYFEGQHINCSSQEEFEKLIKLRLFW